jgi:hypothetical protein
MKEEIIIYNKEIDELREFKHVENLISPDEKNLCGEILFTDNRDVMPMGILDIKYILDNNLSCCNDVAGTKLEYSFWQFISRRLLCNYTMHSVEKAEYKGQK